MSGRRLVPIDGGSAAAGPDGDLALAVRRIRMIVVNSALDCACRQRVDEVLRRYETRERAKTDRRRLETARHQRRKIAAILELLRDIDEIDDASLDEGVLTEASLLFADIAAAADAGADALRGLLP